MEVYNLENGGNTIGNFEVRYDLLDESKTVIDSKLISESIEPQEFKRLKAIFEITNSQGINEDKSCTFKTLNVPKREIC